MGPILSRGRWVIVESSQKITKPSIEWIMIRQRLPQMIGITHVETTYQQSPSLIFLVSSITHFPIYHIFFSQK